MHEMVNQWQAEVMRQEEDAYRGHGRLFRDRTRTAVLSTRIPEELLELLRQLASQEGVTLSAAAAALLEIGLQVVRKTA